MFSSFGYDLRKLSNAYTIKLGEEVCALIGLSNLLWSNRRAELFIYLSKDLEFDVLKYLIPPAIDKYLSFMSQCGLENIVYNANPDDKFMLYILSNTHMNYIGTIPYYFENENGVYSSYLFEYYPLIQVNNNFKIESKLSIKEGSMKLFELEDVIKDKLKVTVLDENGNLVENLKQSKDELPKLLQLDDILFDDGKIKVVSPQYIAGRLKNITNIVAGYIEALTKREEFSIPLGEDKYIIQEGNGKYGISKQVLNFDYIVLNENDEFVGFCNRLETNGRNTRINIAISPEYQNKGIGTKLLSCYYDELCRVGYLAITSYVLEFNEALNKLLQKNSYFVGKRINSYYTNGRLWDINIFVKTK